MLLQYFFQQMERRFGLAFDKEDLLKFRPIGASRQTPGFGLVFQTAVH